MLVSWWARLPVRQWAIKENLNWKLSHHIWDHYMNPADLSFHLGIRLFHFRQRCCCLLHPGLEMTVTGGLAGRAATADQPRLKGKQQKTLFCPFKITSPSIIPRRPGTLQWSHWTPPQTLPPPSPGPVCHSEQAARPLRSWFTLHLFFFLLSTISSAASRSATIPYSVSGWISS